MDTMDQWLGNSQVRNSLKIHQISHWEWCINQYGHPMHYNAETFESAHKPFVKKNARVISHRYAQMGIIALLKRDMMHRIVNGPDNTAHAKNSRGLLLLGNDHLFPVRTWANLKVIHNLVLTEEMTHWEPQWKFNMKNKLWLNRHLCWIARGHAVEWMQGDDEKYGIVEGIFVSDGIVGLIVRVAVTDDREFPLTESTEVDKECPNLVVKDVSEVVLWEDVKESLDPVQLISDWRHYADDKKFFLNRYIT
jgi:hypothetical protein